MDRHRATFNLQQGETTQPDPDCCHVDADCTHDNSCVDTECTDGQCQYSYSQVDSCCSEGAWLAGMATDFEEGSGRRARHRRRRDAIRRGEGGACVACVAINRP